MNSIELLRVTDTGDRIYSCPLCSTEVKIFSNSFHGVCPACHATLMDYKPEVYQERFHKSKAQYKLNIGGFGSGKTTMCCAELAEHVLSTPNGRSLITAPKLQQVRDAVIPELEKFLPRHLIDRKQNSPNIRYTMKNGHEILIYASNDEENLRSLNLTAFYMEEASNIDFSVFTQLQARLRNSAAIIRDNKGQEVDYKFLGLVSTNPDDGWVRDEFLLRAGKIYASESIDRTLYDRIRARHGEDQYHAFLSSSRDNNHLPKSFIQRLCIGKTPSWIRKYIDCQLDVREGAVYPEFAQSIVEPFPIPETWMRIAGFDKGYRDETAMLVLAIDPADGVIYAHEEYYKAEMPMSYHAHEIKNIISKYRLYSPIQADPTVRNRNERDGETYQMYFQKVSGIYLYPGNNDIETGIEKVRDYMYLGKLKIFSSLENIKSEASRYVYKEDEDTPVDSHNHLMDCMRYAIVQLPDNPLEFDGSTIRQNTHDKNFWGSMEKDEDGVMNEGGIYMLKGGIRRGRR